MTDCINLLIVLPLHGTHIQYTTSIPKIQPIDKFQINEINVDLRTSGLITRFSVLTHALYDKSASRSIVYLASVCDLTQRASVSMRKCADWVNLKFVYSAVFFAASRQKSLIDKLKSRVYLMAYSRPIVQLDTTPNLPPAHP